MPCCTPCLTGCTGCLLKAVYYWWFCFFICHVSYLPHVWSSSFPLLDNRRHTHCIFLSLSRWNNWSFAHSCLSSLLCSDCKLIPSRSRAQVQENHHLTSSTRSGLNMSPLLYSITRRQPNVIHNLFCEEKFFVKLTKPSFVRHATFSNSSNLFSEA
ncbi:hypothetical protein M8C21_004739 [Ambrosia artemisiifolia]|uniref:Uncharacterized protein n=1 Tax=Ambrosia artemisiifolia TaxID=4212 RepID=A0AAD5GAL7_AMBAR|nr:hypothetical protein M8C21_004739 [Ambrosia artemisiifolia]